MGLIPVVLGILFCTSPYPIGLLAALLAFQCARELQQMLKGQATVPVLQSVLVAIGVPFLVSDLQGQFVWLWMGFGAWALGILFTYATVKSNQRLLMGGIGSALWASGGLITLLVLHQYRLASSLWSFKQVVLLALVPLWVGDSAGYFIGRKFGKRPLAPKISPKKTIAGGVANLIGCIAAGAALGIWVHVGWSRGLACGLIAGLFGQAGDLFESWVKRSADLKDSGDLLPGHGGVMDRIDSVLFTAPLVAVFLSLMPN